MNGLWRGALAALLGHALLAPGVEGFARLVAALVAAALLVRGPGRGFLLLLLVAGAVGGHGLKLRVDAALRWQGTERIVRVEVVRVGEFSALVRLGHPELPVARAWLSGLESPRVGQHWISKVRVHEVVSRRNPDDRDGIRSGLAAGGILRARSQKGARLVEERGEGLAQRIRDRTWHAWEERVGAGAGLWSALLLADRRGLGDLARARLQSQGLAHLLALSGLHVGVVVGVLLWPMRHRGPARLAWVVPVLLGWVVLAGAGASMVRAVGMVAWIAVARVRGRQSRPIDALAAMALLETCVRPEVTGGVGWWLSYAATLSILRALPALAGRRRVVAALGLSVAAQAGTAVWALDAFGRIPLLSPLVLLVVGPFFTVVLVVGGLAAVLALVAWPGAGAAAALASLLAHSFGLLVGAGTGTGRWALVHPGWDGAGWALALVIAGGLLLPLRFPRKGRTGFVLVVVAVVLAAHVPWGVRELRHEDHRWISLDVGQGDAGVYRCGRRALVVDTGPLSKGRLPAERVVLPYLARRRVEDATLVLTHGHLDHTAGAGWLLSTGRFERLVLARADSAHAWTTPIVEAARRAGVHVRWVVATDTLWSDCCDAICLWPEPDDRPEHTNDRSVVLRLGPRHAPLLAPGDLERTAERVLLRHLRDGQTPVPGWWSLKVAHHGGNTGTDAPWLEWMQPAHALVSCGAGNRYGHPHPAVLDRLRVAGAPARRTDLEGALELLWEVRQAPPRLRAHGRRPALPVPVDGAEGATYAADPARRRRMSWRLPTGPRSGRTPERGETSWTAFPP